MFILHSQLEWVFLIPNNVLRGTKIIEYIQKNIIEKCAFLLRISIFYIVEAVFCFSIFQDLLRLGWWMLDVKLKWWW